MARIRNEFQAIHSEGGLLPPDLLRRIIDPNAKIPGTQPQDYGLPKGERINESITQSWNRLRRHWAEFREAAKHLPEGEAATGLTNDKWSIPLLRELGFGLLPTSPAPEINGRTYAINRFFGPAPIHLVGCGLSLDRRAAGVRGAASANPHGLVQEYLNRSEAHLWAIVSNGLRFRILRDSQALSRQSYLEFDLETLFTGELYSDFVLFWLMAHATRFASREEGHPETCWLEQWTKLAEKDGTRALESLRGGVENALQILGQGFVSHPRNTTLRESLRTGALSLSDFHGQLLRVIYRLIFLFVAEDRTLDGVPAIHPRDDSEQGRLRRECYAAHYGTVRLRELAAHIKGSRHGDLWQQFNLLVGTLSGEERFAAAREKLALPTLGSFLWSPSSTTALNAPLLANGEPLTTPQSPLTPTGTELANADFLEALRQLAFTRQDKVLRPVDYKNLGAEELGGVYESLLALTPQVSGDGARFTFAEFAGNERKTSGSYYTPDSLVQCLLDSALDPVVTERMASSERRAENAEDLTAEEKQYAYQILSRSRGVETRYGTGGNGLYPNQTIPQGGTLRHDVSDSTSRNLNSGQHRGGMGTRENSGIPAFPSHSTGEPSRTGDSSPSLSTHRTDNAGGDSPHAGDLRHPGSTTHCPPAQSYNETEFLKLWENTPLAARRSLLAEQSILAMKVCDPAVGSGHFLVGAAHRLARHLARVRASAQGESEPSPLLYQHALRDVIGRCLYGVDINPMSAELCRVSLWLEALEPGKPLTFLDHHIRVGNSLLGATPALLDKGIPDEAFAPIEGDDKKVCTQWKKRNKEEHKATRQIDMFVTETPPWMRLGDFARAMNGIDSIDDSTPEGIQARQQRYEEMVRGQNYLFNRLRADAWCAAVVWKKIDDPHHPYPITQGLFRQIEENPYKIGSNHRDEIQRLTTQYQFFHWHLAFPDVFQPVANGEIAEDDVTGWTGGFDCVLGNPPWDMQEVKDNEFFSAYFPEILSVKSAKDKSVVLKRIQKTEPALWDTYQKYVRVTYGQHHLMANGGRFPLSCVGRINLYRLFLETGHTLLKKIGRVGIVVPSSFASDSFSQGHFSSLHKEGRLVNLYDFENRLGLFPSVDSRYRFCLLTIGGKGTCTETDFVFFAHTPSDLAESDRHIRLSSQSASILNPISHTAPLFRTRRDYTLTLKMQKSGPIIGRSESESGWFIKPTLMFMMNAEMKGHRTAEEFENSEYRLCGNHYQQGDRVWLPLYEGKMVGMYDHRAASIRFDSSNRVRRNQPVALSNAEHQDPMRLAKPMFWVDSTDVATRCEGLPKWCLCIKDVTSSTNERTCIAAMLPSVALTDSLPWLVTPQSAGMTTCLLANLNSYVFDYVARQKVAGLHLRGHYFSQLPVISMSSYEVACLWKTGYSQLREWILSRALELIYTAWDIEPFAQDCHWSSPPFRWDEERRFHLRCELDAAFFHLYLPMEANGEWRIAEGETAEDLARLKACFSTPRDAVVFIMDTFPIVKRKDEAAYGAYRTKDTILEIYDEMAQVMAQNARAEAAGQQPTAQYQTRLNPPPGPPCDVEGHFLPMSEWHSLDPHLISHIHPPKEEAKPLEAWADVAAMIRSDYEQNAQDFPQNGRERFMYYLLPYIVDREPERDFQFYADAAFLATRTDLCQKILYEQSSRQRLDKMQKQVGLVGYFTADQMFKVSDIRQFLQDEGYIHIDATNGKVSSPANSPVLKTLPTGVSDLIDLVLEATHILHSDQAAYQRERPQVFANFRLEYERLVEIA
jgi:hypothetical protein